MFMLVRIFLGPVALPLLLRSTDPFAAYVCHRVRPGVQQTVKLVRGGPRVRVRALT